MICWSFSSQSSRHHKSQNVRVREVKFWDNVHPHNVSNVKCQMSNVTLHKSHVRCQVSCVLSHLKEKFLTKWWSLSIEGLLSTGPTSSSCRTALATPGLLNINMITIVCYCWLKEIFFVDPMAFFYIFLLILLPKNIIF